MKIYELLDKPERWCKEANARDEAGDPTNPFGETACSWCLLGAVAKCYPTWDAEAIVRRKLRVTIKYLGHLSKWNDAPTRTWEDIITVCKELDV